MELSEQIRMNIRNDSLPPNFRNEIVENGKLVTIRSNLNSTHDINEWVKSFEHLTCTKWNVRDSCPSGEKFVSKKKFVCHHSSFRKVPPAKNKRGSSKNVDCLASLTIKIKLNTKNTRVSDKFVSRGLFAVITISPFHKHSLKVEPLSFLPAEVCEITFDDNFDVSVGSTVSHTANDIEIDENSREEKTEKMVTLFVDCAKKFKSSEQALEKAIEHLQKVSSDGQWENLISSLGTNVPLRKS